MATDFKTFEEFKGELSQPQGAPSSLTYDLSGAPVPMEGQGGAEPAPSAAQSTGQAATAPAFQAPQVGQPKSTAPAATTPGSTPQISLATYSKPQGSNEFLSGLFEPLGSKIGESRQKLQDATAAFTLAAGPYRDFASAGGTGAIDKALATGATTADRDAARSLVDARYAGPAGLDQATLDELMGNLTGLEPRARTLTSYGGAEDLLKGKTAGLTSGQRAMEVRRLLADPEYRAQAQAYEAAFRDLTSDYNRSQEEARGIAEARDAQERDIARLAREDVMGRSSTLAEDLQGRVKAEKERERGLEDTYGRFTKTGSLEDLRALDELSDLDLSGYDTEARRLDEEAEQVKAGIMAKPEYASIADVPLLTLGATSKGREALFLPREYIQSLQRQGVSKKEIKRIQELARARQRELEHSGFASGSAKKRKGGTGDFTHAGMGRFGTLDNLYFKGGEQDFEPEDLRSFVNYELGTAPTRETLASAEERDRYNLLQELLGEADRITETEEPYRASGIASDLEGYKESEGRRLGALEKAATVGSKEWQTAIKRARKKYESGALLRSLGGIANVAPGGKKMLEKAVSMPLASTAFEMGSQKFQQGRKTSKKGARTGRSAKP